jgi:hypothetical protein
LREPLGHEKPRALVRSPLALRYGIRSYGCWLRRGAIVTWFRGRPLILCFLRLLCFTAAPISVAHDSLLFALDLPRASFRILPNGRHRNGQRKLLLAELRTSHLTGTNLCTISPMKTSPVCSIEFPWVPLPRLGAVIAENSGGGAVVGKQRQADRRCGSLFDRPRSAMLIHIRRGETGIG